MVSPRDLAGERRRRRRIKKERKGFLAMKQLYTEIEDSSRKNSSRKALSTLKDLPGQKQLWVSIAQYKDGSFLGESNSITSRWTEYCRELFDCRTWLKNQQ